MKVKVIATGEIVEVERVAKNIFGRTDGIAMLYREDVLDFNFDSPQPEATISGWVAVDDFGNAYIYHSKPTQRCREFCDTGDYITDWWCDTKYPNGKRCYVIDKDFFPNLTPDSEPIEVEITIKPTKQ